MFTRHSYVQLIAIVFWTNTLYQIKSLHSPRGNRPRYIRVYSIQFAQLFPAFLLSRYSQKCRLPRSDVSNNLSSYISLSKNISSCHNGFQLFLFSWCSQKYLLSRSDVSSKLSLRINLLWNIQISHFGFRRNFHHSSVKPRAWFLGESFYLLNNCPGFTAKFDTAYEYACVNKW